MYFVLLITALIAVFYIVIRNYNYWKKKGVTFENPVVTVVSFLKSYAQKISVYDWFVNMYRRYPNEKYVGYYSNGPALLIRDPELIKHVLVTDFKYFYNRFNAGQLSTEPLMRNVLAAEGDLWRLLRQKITPAFSPSKLKAMFTVIEQQTEILSKVVEKLAQECEEIDVRELMARYTTDSTVAFCLGINSDALLNELSEFRSFGRQIFNIRITRIIAMIFKLNFPTVAKNLKFFGSRIERKFVNLVKRLMSERNYTPSGRNDFIDVMLELKQKERIVGESVEKFNLDGSAKTVAIEVDDKLLSAQIFIFFAAAFETNSYASSILLHFLAYHPEEQARCQQNIDEVLSRHDGKLRYDSLKEMNYLEMALKESLRIMPSPSVILRRCSKKYTFPGTNLTIDEGVVVYICTEALHRDVKYFVDPEDFRPERFHPDNIGKIPKNVYLPFGDGPRSCIGERMGVMQALAGAAIILSKFTVAPSKNSSRRPRLDHHFALVKKFVGGLPLSLKLRQ